MEENLKQQLLKDLCGRLLYRPKLQIYYKKISGSDVFDDELYEIDTDEQWCNDGRRLEDVKPYLRPMSTMTEEEKRFYKKYFNWYEQSLEDMVEFIDWLNAHHFDYRGLIPMGLALEAPEGMYRLINSK